MATPSELMSKHRVLSRDDEQDLARRAQQGDEAARHRLAESNVRLVHSIAHKYHDCGMDHDDLFGYGTEGLLKAIDRFDPERGYKFSTYASYWIRQAITRAICQYSRTIRLPEYLRQDLRQLEDEAGEFLRANGDAPTDADLAELTGTTTERISDLRTVAQVNDSLDRELSDEDGNATLADILGLDEPGPEELARVALAHRTLWKLMATILPARQLMILIWRASTDRTLESLAEAFGLSRERIRQLECGAVERLEGELYRRGVDSQMALADLNMDAEIKDMDMDTLQRTPPEERALVAAILQMEERINRDLQELQYLRAYATGKLPQGNERNGDEDANRNN